MTPYIVTKSMGKSHFFFLFDLSTTVNKCKLPAGTNVENAIDCNSGSNSGGCSVADLITSASSVSCASGYSGNPNVGSSSSPACDSNGGDFSGGITLCAGSFADLA